ncbi:hypothetical protein V8C26DRAFT_395016 [Trichoderma gracile]
MVHLSRLRPLCPHHRHRHRYSKLSSLLRPALVSLHSCFGPDHDPFIGQPQGITPSSLDTSADIDCTGDSAVTWPCFSDLICLFHSHTARLHILASPP